MRKMLVAVNGSDSALRALDHAASLAADQPLTIHLLHVWEPISYGDRSHAFHSNEELEQAAREQGEAVLKAAAERAASSGAQLIPELASGEIAPTIAARAKALGCDSIVMGRQMVNPLLEILAESTVTAVLDATELPVTLVK